MACTMSIRPFILLDPTSRAPTCLLPSNESIVIRPDILKRIEFEPDLASNHLGLAFQYSQVQNFNMVESELREALRLEPQNPRLHTVLGVFYLARKNEAASLAELDENIRIAPFGIFQHMAFAGALESFHRTSEAIAELKNLAAMHPTDFVPSSALIDFYLNQKDRNSAIAELRRFLKASSLTYVDQAKFLKERPREFNQLAVLLYQNREFDAAGEHQILIRLLPDSPYLHIDYGNVLLAQRRTDEAIGEYNKMLRLNPGMSSAHQNIGICLSLKKDFDGAVVEFRRTLELNPDEPNTQVFLGTSLAQRGDQKAAMDQFQQFIEKNPNAPEAHASLGRAFFELKDNSQAAREMKLALDLTPDSPATENNLAWLYATADDRKFRNPVEALTLARRAVQTSPEPNSAFLDTLAEALLLNGQPAKALVTEQKAFDLDPENLEIKSRLLRFIEAARETKP